MLTTGFSVRKRYSFSNLALSFVINPFSHTTKVGYEEPIYFEGGQPQCRHKRQGALET